MSEPLWREVDPNSTDAPLRVLRDIDGNRVYQVPVEPDKMWLCWSDKAGSWLRSHHTYQQNCNDRCGDVLIVGIGDNDE